MRITKVVLFITLLISCTFLKAQTQGGVAQQDYDALVAIYNDLDGNNWTTKTNWLSGNVSTWFGVNVEFGRVVKIELPFNKLSGRIPSEIKNLTELKSLDLSYNQIVQNLPSGITSLTKLESLYLQENDIQGTIPSDIGNITGLKNISLAGNLFTDKIPDSFWTLKELVNIGFYSNKLQGEIPEAIGNLTKLKVLRLENNQLEGPLPMNLWNLNQLVRLHLAQNNFRGQIVSNIGNLQNLQYFYLNKNQFSGSIPSSLFTISSLLEIRIGENDFIGAIPSNINNLTNLRVFEAQSNELGGEIPGGICELSKLEQLDLSVNNLTGSIPTDIGDLVLLNSLKLNANKLSGTIPDSFWSLKRLATCNISDNNLSGSISDKIRNLKEMTILDVSSNNFSGVLTSNIGELTKLETLFLNNNDFTGIFPSTANNLQALRNLNIYNNNFIDLPNLDSLVKLDSFNCDSNKFTFEDFQINQLLLGSVKVRYKSQKKFGEKRLLYATDNNPFSFNIVCGGTGNVYTWWYGKIEDGSKIVPTGKGSTETISFNPIKYEQTGFYKVTVTNKSFTNDFILESEDVHVIVVENCIKPDSIKLTQLFTAMGGDKWVRKDNWLTGPINTWYGVTIDQCNVTRIILPENNVFGRIPDTIIGHFPKLEVLDLSGNSISGDIPAEIGDLASLKVLNLSDNEIEGNIPGEINKLNNLLQLDLSHNWMDGGIPRELGDVSSLQVLKLNNNYFSGELNGNIADLDNLVHLDISTNQLEGSIDKTIEGMLKIKQFIANNNQLSGVIPSTIGLLTSLDTLRLENNLLSGSIPSEMGNLSNMIFLGLSNNQLTDNIPETLWDLANLEILLLGDNDLTGEVSGGIGNLTKLLVLTMNNNELEGKIPDSFKNLDELKQLYLNSNQFEGDLPEGVGNFTNLEIIKLDSNNFSSVPSFNLVDSLVSTENNRLTFEDLERSKDSIRRGEFTFSYDPQQEFGRKYDTVAIEGSLFTLPIFCGGAYNHYQWYKDGNLISGPDNFEIIFPAFQPSDTGTYYITVINDTIENLTLKSRPVHVKLLPRPVTKSPYCGTINLPLNQELCWEDLDWEDSYSLQVAKDSMFTELVVREDNYRETCYFNDWEWGTTYFWKVSAEKDGVFSSWSDVCSFTTQPEIPDCPEYITPADKFEFFYDQPLTIKWGEAPRADTIIFQLSKDPDFSKKEFIVIEIVDSVFNEYSFLPSELENATYYYWRVLPKNFTGTTECETRTLIPAIEVIPVNLVAIDGAHITNFTVKNIETYPDNYVRIYTRWGKQIYEKTGYANEFDFSNYPSGTYYYILNVSNGLNKKQYKSFVEVVKK